MAIPGGCDYELMRKQRIEDNRRRMEDMGLLKQKTILDSFRVVKRAPSGEEGVKKTYIRKQQSSRAAGLPPRRSKRLEGEKVDYCEIGENDMPVFKGPVPESKEARGLFDAEGELVDLLDRRAYREAVAQLAKIPEPSQEALEAVQAARCASQGRGSIYDSNVGITCHFCRQKKLCGEDDCTRCAKRDPELQCTGKTECTKCGSATGRFCRACLHIRYGQTLEEARVQMAAGDWLCPHCYEEEHPEDGWICNSSICMKRRGLKPTGIAIYDAHERGFKSVAHLLQAELQKRGPAAVLGGAASKAGAAGEGDAEQAGNASEAGAGATKEGGEGSQGSGSAAASAEQGDGSTQEDNASQELQQQSQGGSDESAATQQEVTTRGRPKRAAAQGLGVVAGGVSKARAAAAVVPQAEDGSAAPEAAAVRRSARGGRA